MRTSHRIITFTASPGRRPIVRPGVSFRSIAGSGAGEHTRVDNASRILRPQRPFGLLSWRRLVREPFVCFLLLFAIMMAMMCIAAVHRTGMSRALLGNWANVRW